MAGAIMVEGGAARARACARRIAVELRLRAIEIASGFERRFRRYPDARDRGINAAGQSRRQPVEGFRPA